jgi:hypothetical protein
MPGGFAQQERKVKGAHTWWWAVVSGEDGTKAWRRNRRRPGHLRSAVQLPHEKGSERACGVKGRRHSWLVKRARDGIRWRSDGGFPSHGALIGEVCRVLDGRESGERGEGQVHRVHGRESAWGSAKQCIARTGGKGDPKKKSHQKIILLLFFLVVRRLWKD